jgi:hypothetical protein
MVLIGIDPYPNMYFDYETCVGTLNFIEIPDIGTKKTSLEIAGCSKHGGQGFTTC